MHTRRELLDHSLLYLVTPARPPAGELDAFLPAVIEAGVDIVQLRQKDMEAGELLRYCEVVRRWTLQLGALFVVNDRVDVALAAGADGVHLGQGDLPYMYARAQGGPELLIGRSNRSSEQLLASLDEGADYAAIGPVHATPTKPGRLPVGLEPVRRAARLAGGGPPIFAIGGIDPGNLPSVIEAGARRVCVVRALTEAADPAGAARTMKAALQAARAE